jgi:4a-hydroxytetrahydrobiopterin dehydratase
MELKEKRCVPCEGTTPPIPQPEAERLLSQLQGWSLGGGGKSISKEFSFDSYWAGLGFVNAVAWMAQKEKHHPDLLLLYKKARVLYSTHAIGGLSENDFICAAKVDALAA